MRNILKSWKTSGLGAVLIGWAIKVLIAKGHIDEQSGVMLLGGVTALFTKDADATHSND